MNELRLTTIAQIEHFLSALTRANFWACRSGSQGCCCGAVRYKGVQHIFFAHAESPSCLNVYHPRSQTAGLQTLRAGGARIYWLVGWL